MATPVKLYICWDEYGRGWKVDEVDAVQTAKVYRLDKDHWGTGFAKQLKRDGLPVGVALTRDAAIKSRRVSFLKQVESRYQRAREAVEAEAAFAEWIDKENG